MTDAPKLLSREDIIAAKAAIESLADDPTGWATFAVRGVAWRAAEAIAALEAERDALQRFKEYVHARLDHMGVPVCPPGPHLDAGCRIGQRLDWLLAERAAAIRALKPGEAE